MADWSVRSKQIELYSIRQPGDFIIITFPRLHEFSGPAGLHHVYQWAA